MHERRSVEWRAEDGISALKLVLVLIGLAIALPVGCSVAMVLFYQSGKSAIEKQQAALKTAPPNATPDSKPAASPTLKWFGGPDAPSAMDDTPSVSYALNAENTFQDWVGRTQRAQLLVRCKDKKSELFIDVGTPAQPELGRYSRATVRLRFEDGPPERQVWSESTNNKALFAPNSVALMRRLAKTQRLRFGFNAFHSTEQVSDFDVRGFDRVVGEIAKPCGWKP